VQRVHAEALAVIYVRTILSFTIPGPPQPKERARKGKSGKWYTPERTRRYEAHVHTCALAGVSPQARERCFAAERIELLSLLVFFPDGRRRDGDNVAKAIQDALNGVLWVDDSRIRQLSVTKSVDPSNPRVDVQVQFDRKEKEPDEPRKARASSPARRRGGRTAQRRRRRPLHV
jgi:Holliday junction resolvase RusA-like endonuclease